MMLGLCLVMTAHAQDDETIDISGDNTSSNYVSYSKSINIADGKTVNVKMARYCYFSSKVKGPDTGTLNLYGGGERCYLGTEKGKAWADLSGFSGLINIYPFVENSPDAGAHGVVLAHGGKSSSADNALADLKAGKAFRHRNLSFKHPAVSDMAAGCEWEGANRPRTGRKEPKWLKIRD